MTVIVSVNPDLVELHTPDREGDQPGATLLLTDTAGELHRLELRGAALRELATIVRRVQAQFPGLLGGH